MNRPRTRMQLLRLAYITQFLLALIAVFLLWSEIGGQGHLDLMPWYLKLALGAGAAFCVVRATIAAVSHAAAWNGGTLKWLGLMLALLAGCGLASYYYHLYGESDENDDGESNTVSRLIVPQPLQQVPHLFFLGPQVALSGL